MTKPTKTDLCYFAGLIDIKGAFSKKNSNQRLRGPQLTLYVESKEFPVINRIAKLTGTSPELQAEKPLSPYLRTACLEHCPEAHEHVKPEPVIHAKARWTASGPTAAVVLYNILPHMRTARGWEEFYQECLSAAPLDGNISGTAVKSLRKLDSLGWTFPPEFFEIKRKLDQDP